LPIEDLDFLTGPEVEGPRSILCVCDGAGATWRISFDLPLRRLRASGEVRLTALTEAAIEAIPTWNRDAVIMALLDELRVDVLVLSRCSAGSTLVLAAAARHRGVPTIYHLDDDLLLVPRELGGSKSAVYNDPARRLRMRRLIEDADLVYCSTPALARRMTRLKLRREPFAGTLYCSVTSPMAPYRPRFPMTIGYMGTAGHAHDLEAIVPALSLILSSYSDVAFELLGTVAMPPLLAKLFPRRVRHRPGVPDYDAFLVHLRDLGWAVALAPLAPSPFNAAKADTKFVEYTMAGMPVVASDTAVYRNIAANGAGLLATNALEWSNAISRLLTKENVAADQVARAQKRLAADYRVELLEHQVMAVFDAACQAAKSL
jgi:glycosyltransferase involved in cell wall biosynthesis